MEYVGIFQGGGMKGLAYMGAICALEERGIKAKKVAGTSIGAVFASLLATGYTGKEITYLSKHIDFTKLLYKPNNKLTTCIKELGCYSSEYIEELLNSLYNRKGYHYVSDLNKNNLKVIASDITKRKKIVLPDELWQYDIDENNITLARMVTLSLLYPVFFKPLTLNKSKIVDGGLFDSFPIGAITDNNLKKIGFQLISKKSKKISTLDYLVDIDTKFIKTLDFRITHNEIARLFDQGYFAAKRIIPIIEKHNKIM